MRIALVHRMSPGFAVCVLAVLSLLVVSATPAQQDQVTRTRQEIEALIEQMGRTPPAWWDSVALRYPETLDLTWPKAEGPWNSQKNVGQYLWDVINPNPHRWQEGVRFLHHLLAVNKDNREVLIKIMDALGGRYHDLLEDWPRAVFWWRKAAEMGGNENPLGLAHSYWKMGSREMTTEILSRYRTDYTRHGAVIKLWADLGEYDRALKLAESKVRYGRPDTAYLAAGDVYRSAGWYDQALEYYQKVLEVPDREKPWDLEMNRKRARANLDAIRLFEGLDISRVPDGAYEASSIGYAGQIHVEVQVKESRITAVEVMHHKEKQFYSAIEDTSKQIIAKQSVRGIDATTGATITSEAIINATAKALANASR